MEINELLNKYFEGETSVAEEKELRRYFTTESDIPANMLKYKPLFVYFDNEIERTNAAETIELKPQRNVRKITLWISTVAASVAVMFCFFKIAVPTSPCAKSGNYVMINGRCYTDQEKMHEAAKILKKGLEMQNIKTLSFDEIDTDDVISKEIENLNSIINN